MENVIKVSLALRKWLGSEEVNMMGNMMMSPGYKFWKCFTEGNRDSRADCVVGMPMFNLFDQSNLFISVCCFSIPDIHPHTPLI